jgi:hypothetical protein
MNRIHELRSRRQTRLTLIACLATLLPRLANGEDTAYRISAKLGPYFVCDRRVIEDYWNIERFVVPLTTAACP